MMNMKITSRYGNVEVWFEDSGANYTYYPEDMFISISHGFRFNAAFLLIDDIFEDEHGYFHAIYGKPLGLGPGNGFGNFEWFTIALSTESNTTSPIEYFRSHGDLVISTVTITDIDELGMK
jgi:hypothetical protein